MVLSDDSVEAGPELVGALGEVVGSALVSLQDVVTFAQLTQFQVGVKVTLCA
jgi:hypothetical protein